MPWYYLKKDLRTFHETYIMKKVNPILREYKITFYVDMDPKDWGKVKLHKKNDRQIVTLILLCLLALRLSLLLISCIICKIFGICGK